MTHRDAPFSDGEYAWTQIIAGEHHLYSQADTSVFNAMQADSD